ncbi:Protein C830.03 in chromosome III, putative [Brugia malayi]|uniref:Protein C830.03 in chromosome III, putative n=4 Tax=Brugia TaxID=6278 RepID=A0A4E9F1U8_BRUMA|nr:Protein C830.03 in chromosome III, putative [Brugia malayi]VIO89824.1 Protein C830.03 in chromosome III, putative [Brugia malayi]
MSNDIKSLDGYFHQCYRPDYSLAILKHNCRISIFGVFDIQILFGKVVSRGYEFEPGAYAEERFIKIAAPYSIGPPAQFVSFQDNLFNLHRVKWRLKELTNAVDSILKEFENGDSVLLFRFNFSKICACLRELHGQIFFLPSNYNECYSVGPLCSALQIRYPPLYSGRTAESISQLMEQILNESQKGKRNITMVIGNKNTGKSMLTRVLANSVLGKGRSPPYILDCDVGQPEMNPPGSISLLKVTSPLLGAPPFQQRILLSDTYFYGKICVNDDSSSYLVILRKLLDCFLNDSLSSSPLFINTCGWVEGKGASLLDEMLELFDPDFVFTFVDSTGSNYMVKQSVMNGNAKPLVFYGDAIEKPMHMIYSSSVLRSLRITAYMAELCPIPTLKSFADAAPSAILFRDVAVLIHTNEPFPSNHIFAVLNCTFVALCVHNSINHSEEDKRLFDDQDMPILLNPDKIDALRVVGYGFIRAIDLEERMFFISTPLEFSDLQEVNVLARGLNIDLPQHFLISQGRSAIPYVVRERSSSFHTELFKELKIKSAFHRKRFLRMQSQFMVKKPMYRPVHRLVNV